MGVVCKFSFSTKNVPLRITASAQKAQEKKLMDQKHYNANFFIARVNLHSSEAKVTTIVCYDSKWPLIQPFILFYFFIFI